MSRKGGKGAVQGKTDRKKERKKGRKADSRFSFQTERKAERQKASKRGNDIDVTKGREGGCAGEDRQKETHRKKERQKASKRGNDIDVTKGREAGCAGEDRQKVFFPCHTESCMRNTWRRSCFPFARGGSKACKRPSCPGGRHACACVCVLCLCLCLHFLSFLSLSSCLLLLPSFFCFSHKKNKGSFVF